MTQRRLGVLLAMLAGGMLITGTPAVAQVGASASPMPTRVLAEGTLTPKATPAAIGAILEREVPATLELYLAGRIDDWYAKTDQTGVVFILNVTTVQEARALLEPLPLGKAGLMTFKLTPIGPLRPLGLLLRHVPGAGDAERKNP